MTCLEAQSNIMAFIDKKLPDDKATEFVRHMKYCSNCSDELEIYYTLIVGVRQLDNNEELSRNFKKEMEAELSRIDNRAKKVKRLKKSTFIIAFSLFVMIGLFIYTACLNKVYRVEQRLIKESQGEYFFYTNMQEYMQICKNDIITDINEEYIKDNIVIEKTKYQIIKEYNIINTESE